MTVASIIALWQFAAVIVGLLFALAVASFVVLCIVGVVLWAARAGRDDAIGPETEPDWFEAL